MSHRRAARLAAAACAVVLVLAGPAPARADPHIIRGADVSSLPRVEAAGAMFRDSAGPADAVVLLRAAGIDGARLRLWHSPADGACDLAATIAMTLRLHRAGMSVLLDIHYSDTWADPGHQAKPAAWREVTLPALADSVRAYTRDVLAAFRVAGALPECVQLGNEIGRGMLWPDGRVSPGADAAAWARLTALLRAAAHGAREGAGGRRVRVMLHYEGGGDAPGAREFFDHAVAAGVPFDCIGLSYYPWWHGSLDALAANLAGLHARFHREIRIVETGYPWTLAWWDSTHNVLGLPSQLVVGAPATPAGQRAFVLAVLDRARHARGCDGIYYWEPAWVTAPRAGSPWENAALFDSTGRALPALEALGRGR